ncbi:GntR family transcriptional regulator [Thermobifida cellulosilytica]|uniref:HTH gntR-type domain-containing protein n=1 Tax=Thermobifida cellulosilytica TB100 TaxID=665004 RepID=A0A147KKF2_THECS|nr:GntR family transcriptional regulator [Thermobifida cellulosilytica]KUP97782.1 hypothetical protein AC529_04855 [Thermobifida cellulosilytica TB100]
MEWTVPSDRYGPDTDIDAEAADPVWVQLASILAARIVAGRYQRGRVIPSENQVIGEFGVARSTVRKAVKLLVEEGLVRTVHGRGSYVREDLDV